jgi:hypothetical protein
MDINLPTKEVINEYLKVNSRNLLNVLKVLDLTKEDDYKLASSLIIRLIRKVMMDSNNFIFLDTLNCHVENEREFAMQLGWIEAIEEFEILKEKLESLLDDKEN